MIAPFLAPFWSAVKTSTWKFWDTRNKNPSRINDLGLFLGRPGKAWDGLKPGYIMSIIT